MLTVRTLLALSLLISIIIFPKSGMAQNEAYCRDVLNELEWTLVEPNSFSNLRSERSGSALHGIACSEEEITSWFESHNWTLLRRSIGDGGFNGFGETRHRRDKALVFCLPKSFLLRLITANCAAQASIVFHEGRVTQVCKHPARDAVMRP